MKDKIDIRAVNRVQAKIWYYQLSQQAGDRSTYWFAKHCHIGSRYTKTWDRYRSGERLPRIYKGKDPVSELGELFKHSDEVFRSPIWRVLKGEKFTHENMEAGFSKFNLTLRSILQGKGLWPYKVDADGSVSTNELIQQLSNIEDFETLEAIILLMGAADTVGNKEFRCALDDLYRHMIPSLILRDTIPFIGELFDVVDNFSCHRYFSHSLGTEDTDKSWRDELPRYRKQLIDFYSSNLKLSDGFIGIGDEILTKEWRQQIAQIMVEYVWQDEAKILKSSGLWRPMSWAVAQIIRGHVKWHNMTEKRFAELMDGEISLYLKADNRTREQNDFCVPMSG